MKIAVKRGVTSSDRKKKPQNPIRRRLPRNADTNDNKI
jgi:hypothetical protein